MGRASAEHLLTNETIIVPGNLIRANCPAGKANCLTYYLILHKNIRCINALQAGIPLASPG